jgi:hypothetical protein
MWARKPKAQTHIFPSVHAALEYIYIERAEELYESHYRRLPRGQKILGV